jgi:hypothetical protein
MHKKISYETFIKSIFICLILLPVFIPFTYYIKNKQQTLNYSELTLFSDFEYDMGIWIRDNTPINSVVLSDPETIYLLSGLSGRNAIIPNTMVVQSLQFSDQIKLKLIKVNILNTLDPELAYNYSYIIGKNYKVIIVISGRTAEWVSTISYQYIQKPDSYYGLTGFQKFFNQSYFRCLKSCGENQIFAFELIERDYKFFKNYDIFFINNIEEYENISIYAKDSNEAINQWYLEKTTKNGPVSSIVYNQYYCWFGNPPVVKWDITISNFYNQISLFIFNLNILNIESNYLWRYSKNGSFWISGNLSDPLQHLFDFKTNGNKKIAWLGHNGNPNNKSKLGTFIFLGFYY